MPILFVAVVWVAWGLSYPLLAIVLRGVDPMTARIVASAIGAAGLFVQAAIAGNSLRVERAAWRDLCVSGFLNMSVFPIGMVVGIYLMSPGRTAVLVYTMPVWATLFARLLLGEAITRRRAAALALGVGAVAMLMSQDLSNLRNAPLGAAATLVAALGFGLGTVWLKRRAWREDPSVVAAWQLALGIVPMLPVWAALSLPLDLSRATPLHWGLLVYAGLVANALAYFAWFRLVRILPAGVSAISALAVPCIGLASSAYLTGEALHGRDWLALALIAAALLLVLFEPSRLAPAKPGALRARDAAPRRS